MSLNFIEEIFEEALQDRTGVNYEIVISKLHEANITWVNSIEELDEFLIETNLHTNYFTTKNNFYCYPF